MASVVLFHSAYGLRPAILADAEWLRAAGHTVLTPDLYQGKTFDTAAAGAALRDELGWPELVVRARAAVEGLPPGQVWAGYSMGAAMAWSFLRRAAEPAAGLVMANSIELRAGESLRAPTQFHVATDDAWVEEAELDEAAARGAELFRYSGGHLFADPDLPDYDPVSAGLLRERILAFLSDR
jgi:dienelactone hydrolase